MTATAGPAPWTRNSTVKDISYVIDPTEIEWEMDWSGRNPDGTRKYPDKPEKEPKFEADVGLALMLNNDVFHLNSSWWEDTWPREAREATYFGVDCSDVFAWGCSDAENLAYRDIETLYRMWLQDRVWGPAVWCMIRRREMPQAPVERRIREAGIWNLDELRIKHGLRANHYDGVSTVFARHKYEAYCAWELSEEREPRPYDATWWDGWKLFVAANPDWNDAAWQGEDDRRREEWKHDSGHAAETVVGVDEDPQTAARQLANMLETVAERRSGARTATSDMARTYLTQEADRTERDVLARLPALLAAIAGGAP